MRLAIFLLWHQPDARLKPRATSVQPQSTLSSQRSIGFIFCGPRELRGRCVYSLNKSSKAWRAPPLVLDPAVGELVWRSMVVRGEKSAHAFFASFGETRAVSASCEHSNRALVSNDAH
jgi:hypothetical protein